MPNQIWVVTYHNGDVHRAVRAFDDESCANDCATYYEEIFGPECTYTVTQLDVHHHFHIPA